MSAFVDIEQRNKWKKENKLQEIEPLPVSQIFSQIKPAIWAHGSDELRARFQKKY